MKQKKLLTILRVKVSDWKAVAEKYSISKSEQLMMEKAFKVK